MDYKETKTYKLLEKDADYMEIDGVRCLNTTAVRKEICDAKKVIPGYIMQGFLKGVKPFKSISIANYYRVEDMPRLIELYDKFEQSRKTPKQPKTQPSLEARVSELEKRLEQLETEYTAPLAQVQANGGRKVSSLWG